VAGGVVLIALDDGSAQGGWARSNSLRTYLPLLCGAAAAFGSGFVKEAYEFHVLADLATVLAGGMLLYGWYTAARVNAAVSTAR
ncbi:MAG: hypothetical protein ACPHIW_06310, partial [Ilumatobacteraceae bacterium]